MTGASCETFRFRLPGGRVLAAPSWLIPGALADNCRFLAGRVDEVGLLFFETAACAAYTANDVPADLADLPLSYHVHLPVDLPWGDPRLCARICAGLLDKVSFLRPGRAVLHPPEGDTAAERLGVFLETFAGLGHAPDMLLPENIRGCDLLGLEGVIREFRLQVCLDLGHVRAYGQEALLDCPALTGRAGMLHLSAGRPGRDRHRPLTELDREGSELLRRLLAETPPDAVLMPEIFSLPGFEASIDVLSRALEGRSQPFHTAAP